MADLAVKFCGLGLINPFVLASGTATATGAMIERAYGAGWAGAVTRTFGLHPERYIRNIAPRLASLAFSGPSTEARRIFALESIGSVSDRTPDAWLNDIHALASSYPDRLTVASIFDDPAQPGGWQLLAAKCVEAGARAIEMDFSLPHGLADLGPGQLIGHHPRLAARLIGWLREAVDVPLIARLSPDVTDITVIARAVKQAGADAVTGIAKPTALMGVDLETLAPLPNIWGGSCLGGLSGPSVKPLALGAVARLARSCGGPVIGLGGVTTWRDAAEFMLLGAGLVEVGTAVMIHGFDIIAGLTTELNAFLDSKGLASTADLIGLSLDKVIADGNLDDRSRLTAHVDANRCIQCNACVVSCRDAGFQAMISREGAPVEVDPTGCTGCSLCYHVCPVDGCVAMIPTA